jgi:alpha-1,6-mannosyltransferase
VLESLACGTPAVVPAAGATPELVAGAGGEVCEGTPAGLADGVLRLLDRPAAERRASARARAEDFPWSATVAGLLAAHTAARNRAAARPDTATATEWTA